MVERLSAGLPRHLVHCLKKSDCHYEKAVLRFSKNIILAPNYMCSPPKRLVRPLLLLCLLIICKTGFCQQSGCSDWLFTPSKPSAVNIGKLNVTGNKITVEAEIYQTANNPVLNSADIVSKHSDPSDNNYLLRPHYASITTTAGFFQTPEVCPLEDNKRYHVAMVYDGMSLKFYRNGYLMSQIAAHGDLIQNDFNTRIGYYEYAYWDVQFFGYINNVRIWNIARSQSEIRANMFVSLQNPKSQAGLLACYTFNDLKNKQGDSRWDGTLVGNARIKENIPDCKVVVDSCANNNDCGLNWLFTPSKTSAVNIGKLGVTGNNITVEAEIFQTANNPVLNSADIVSKHSDPTDVNYLLRNSFACVTTTDGYFQTPDICPMEDNKRYHIAMVYDGLSLKFYRNGFLMSEIAAHGNLIQNDFNTRIGFYEYEYWDEQFFGYINNVRIWNVARSREEIQTYMNGAIPNPETQAGLLAAYTFDNLKNKQGNPNWNGILVGSATINERVPDCNFIADSCKDDDIIINDYTEVTGFDPCTNELRVTDGSSYNTGDVVLIIQMKGAVIDTTNSAHFGMITDFGNAGNYEFNRIESKVDNRLTLTNIVNRQFDIANGKVQLVRVPYYEEFSNTSRLTCYPWDGSKGGITVLYANRVSLSNDIDVSAKGFRHGRSLQAVSNFANEEQYYYSETMNKGAGKGEGIYELSEAKNFGRGAAANGGGGGNAFNSGGGGGSNGGHGGHGGDQASDYKVIAENVGGDGGKVLSNAQIMDKFYLGGGGGLGQGNNVVDHSGNGGGMIIIRANELSSNGFFIRSNGGNASEIADNGADGGGAGGSVVLDIDVVSDDANVEVAGGKGGSHITSDVMRGPGGGGGGGVLAISQPNLPSYYQVNLSGGMNGVNTNFEDDAYGATAGENGKVIYNISVFKPETAFKKNIDSVKFNFETLSCDSVRFDGVATVQNFPIIEWSWNFGDENSSTGQHTGHRFETEANFPVKLIVTDQQGCKDSTVAPVYISPLNIAVIDDQEICLNASVTLNASGGSSYHWIPATGLDDPDIADPVANPVITTKYYVTVFKSPVCQGTDSVLVTVRDLPEVVTSRDTTICPGTDAFLSAAGGITYDWTPSISLNDPTISNPVAHPTETTLYNIEVTNEYGCSAGDSIKVSLYPLPEITKTPDTTICNGAPLQLHVSGGVAYHWAPGNLLDDAMSASPVVIDLPGSTTFKVEIRDEHACSYFDSVRVTIRPEAVFSISSPLESCLNTPVRLVASGGDEYKWSPDLWVDNPTSATVLAIPDTTTTFSVLISENACGKSETLYTKVSVLPVPAVGARSSNNITCTKPFTLLSAEGSASNYRWTPAVDLSDANSKNPVSSAKTTTLYTVTATDRNGCENHDSVLVKVEFSGNGFVGLPTAFSPNGDGLNDCFGAGKLPPVTELRLSVFNRYGERVFFTDRQDKCWDGTYKGIAQASGSFVYILTANTVCGSIDQKGTVTLIR